MAGRDSRTPGFPSQCPWVPLDVCSLPPALPTPVPMPMAMPMLQFFLDKAAPYLKSCGCPEVLLGAALLLLLHTPTLLLLLYLGQEEVLRMGAAESPPCPTQPHISAPPAPAPRFWGAELMGAPFTKPSCLVFWSGESTLLGLEGPQSFPWQGGHMVWECFECHPSASWEGAEEPC